MSASEISRFSNDLQNDAQLLEQVKALGNDLGTVVSFANGKGYEFSEAEVAELASKKDLTDEELDQVAGGQFVFGGDVVGVGVAVSF